MGQKRRRWTRSKRLGRLKWSTTKKSSEIAQERITRGKREEKKREGKRIERREGSFQKITRNIVFLKFGNIYLSNPNI